MAELASQNSNFVMPTPPMPMPIPPMPMMMPGYGAPWYMAPLPAPHQQQQQHARNFMQHQQRQKASLNVSGGQMSLHGASPTTASSASPAQLLRTPGTGLRRTVPQAVKIRDANPTIDNATYLTAAKFQAAETTAYMVPMPSANREVAALSPKVLDMSEDIQSTNKFASSSSQAATVSSPMNASVVVRVPQANVIGTTVSVRPKSGMQLQRELQSATREELVHILVELSNLNQQAQSFISSKADLIALKCPTPSASRSCAVPYFNQQTPYGDVAAITPSRALDLTEGGDGSNVTPGVTSTHIDCNMTPATSACYAGVSNTHSKVIRPHTADSRPFVTERTPATPSATAYDDPSTSSLYHPCLRMYGNCRMSASCIYSRLPRNICISWIRGECPLGSSCNLVHRLPQDCCEQVKLVYKLYHGARRDDPAVVAEICRSRDEALQRSATAEIIVQNPIESPASTITDEGNAGDSLTAIPIARKVSCLSSTRVTDAGSPSVSSIDCSPMPHSEDVPHSMSAPHSSASMLATRGSSYARLEVARALVMQ